MASKKRVTKPKQSERTARVEWVGGLFALPAYVSGDPEPYRPEAIVWMGRDKVLGWAQGKPGEVLGGAVESLKKTIASPIYGSAHRPSRVRVGSPELADALAGAFPDIEIVCGPTPEIDHLSELMREKLGDFSDAERSYLSPGIGPEPVAAFFSAAAALFRAAPWRVVPHDQSLFAVSVEELGLRYAALSVIGQLGESFGLLMFSCIEDFEAYLELAGSTPDGERPAPPPHFVLNFDRGAELEPALRKEIASHRWEVAGPNAYPWLVAVDEDLVGRPPTRDELTLAEALCRALVEILAEPEAIRAAFAGGPALARQLRVPTHDGELSVELRAPYADDAGDADGRALVRQFAASPEALALPEVGFCEVLLDYATSDFGATLASLSADELDELLFEVVPRQFSIDASAARPIIEETRALYTFLKRVHGLEQADACLRLLEGDAVDRLAAALSDSRNFGMAKSFFMAGREAGFDMETREGIEAWLNATEHLFPGTSPRPTPAQARAKKQRRKASRKARRANR